ncbi:small multidrug efflux protein, partial [Desertihabitans aurantiacus]|uniref:small multidrug efflux protein n=1 Tax=Desertihabitans aurantiacus TaxID=2282477 RepID=UPI000DF7D9DF
GNLLCVLGVVLLTARARAAVVSRRSERVAAGAGAPAPEGEEGTDPAAPAEPAAKPKSKGRQRFDRWLVRFGVPGASLLGPLAVPTPFTAALLVGGGTPRGWVLLWQAVAIVLWTTIATVSAWLALQVVTLV